MRELDTKLKDNIYTDIKIDFDKLVKETSKEQREALPDDSILLAALRSGTIQ